VIAERRANRTMRHHIRGWITRWDVLRVQGIASDLIVTTADTDYGEDASLTEAPPEDPATE
jgi:hypothetical protein